MHYSSLLVEEAYYWNYTQHLDFSYLDHPPMVALLIKTFTMIFGTQEFFIRLPSLLCWAIAAFFSYQLSELMNKGAGLYSVMLLAILPFYFFESIIITPDAPLIACWSASVYCLYRSLVLNEAHYWYATGFWLGLGMLSKYTICLLGLAALFYIIITPKCRFWFLRKEPYIGVLISLILFIPVIYWNINHEWSSFLFQSQSRFNSVSSIDIHKLIGLVLLFMTPLGTWGLVELIKKTPDKALLTHVGIKKFILIFTLIPLGFFALFCLNHKIKFNWIGPVFLALIPWIGSLISYNTYKRILWFRMAFILLLTYSSILLVMSYNKSPVVQQKAFAKIIDWKSLIKQFNQVARTVELKNHMSPIFVPLDNYPIASELNFYQTKFLADHQITKKYPVIGSHLFGAESLMYRYWDTYEQVLGMPLIIISKELWRFDDIQLITRIIELSPLKTVWARSEGQGVKSIPYYYKVVQMKNV
ncbi:MAG: glycosyltransferase family 39 protein [bacterium]|nr:glycosyltransferase family 39 protein [bacterium]